MKTKVFLFTISLAVAGMISSCGSDSAADQAKNAAKAEVENINAGKPAADAPAVPMGPTTTISFDEGTEHEFGTIDEGDVVAHVFKFKNTGEEPLVLTNAKGSCGCTVPTWPKEPIAPGETGEINVEFNSKGKSGKQNKKVTLTANTNPAQTFLYVKGEVTPDPNKKAPATK